MGKITNFFSGTKGLVFLIVSVSSILGLTAFLLTDEGEQDLYRNDLAELSIKSEENFSDLELSEDRKEGACSKVGDVSILVNRSYPFNKVDITSEEGHTGGSMGFPNDSFYINDGDLVLEGVNLPEVNRIVVKWNLDMKDVEIQGFEKGDTHWCFDVSEEKGNLRKGENVYWIKFYLDNEEFIELSAKVVYSAFKDEVEDNVALKIDWLPEAVSEPVTNFFSKEQLDNFYTECNYHPFENDWQVACYDLFKFYKAGSVSDGSYKGYDYYLLSITTIGHGESDDYFRLLFNDSDKRLILLTKYSNEPSGNDMAFFTAARNITVENLLPPKEIKIPNTDYYLEHHSDSPNVLFSDMIVQKANDFMGDIDFLFTDKAAGDIYIDNTTKTFFARVNDGSVKIYRMKMPFIKSREETDEWNADDLLLDIKFLDGTQNAERYFHGSRFQFVCAGGELYDVVLESKLDVESQLELIGASSSGEKFYGLKDEKELKNIYDVALDYTGRQYVLHEDMSFEDFKKIHPVIFWKDPFGRWVQFTNNVFSVAAECGGGMGRSAI